MKTDIPKNRKVDHGKLKDYQPESSFEQEVSRLADISQFLVGKINRGASQENKDWCAEMGNETGEKKKGSCGGQFRGLMGQ